MVGSVAEALVLACPAALSCATVVVAERRVRARWRDALNRRLHELRRPLQVLALEAGRSDTKPRDQLAQALAALQDVERELNGDAPRRRTAVVDARALAAETVGRWRGPAALEGRSIELAWNAARSTLVGDEAAIAGALDNLVANALEHGQGSIRVEGTARAGRLRLSVADGADAGSAVAPATAPPRVVHRHQAGTRRGHGLRIVAEVASDHGGRFAACAHDRGSSAVLELPLAGGRVP